MQLKRGTWNILFLIKHRLVIIGKLWEKQAAWVQKMNTKLSYNVVYYHMFSYSVTQIKNEQNKQTYMCL